MTSGQPTPQGISRLLARAGFERSVSRTTRVKGWHDWNEGFKAERGYGSDHPEVIVRHRMDKWARGDAADDRHSAMLDRYAVAIRAAGYAVRRNETSGWHSLTVTAGGEDGDE